MDEELQGRINGLSMVVELVLMELFRIKHGSTDEALKAIKGQLEPLRGEFEKMAARPYRDGSMASLNLVMDRLEGIFGDKQTRQDAQRRLGHTE